MLRELIRGTSMVVRGPDTVEVTTIAIDSKQVTAGSLFVAIKGITRDGHDYLVEAIARGASVLVVEDARIRYDGAPDTAVDDYLASVTA